MSSKASYDPVGKARPQTADAETGNDEASGNGASAKAGSKAEGFTVRVRRMGGDIALSYAPSGAELLTMVHGTPIGVP